jgi:hypothetical protein
MAWQLQGPFQVPAHLILGRHILEFCLESAPLPCEILNVAWRMVRRMPVRGWLIVDLPPLFSQSPGFVKYSYCEGLMEFSEELFLFSRNICILRTLLQWPVENPQRAFLGKVLAKGCQGSVDSRKREKSV